MSWPDTSRHEIQILKRLFGYSIKYDPFRKTNRFTVLNDCGRVGPDVATYKAAIDLINKNGTQHHEI